MSQLWLYIVYVINGFLMVVYYTVEHVATLLLLFSTTSFAVIAPKEQRSWSAASAILAILTSMAAPFPVPLALLAISAVGWIGQWLERFNQPAQSWSTVRAQAVYAILGIAYTAYSDLGGASLLTSNPDTAQAGPYINTILSIALLAFPVGFIAMLVQSLWAHPPTPGGSPVEMISTIRTRGKG